jgi:hypothetical protein
MEGMSLLQQCSELLCAGCHLVMPSGSFTLECIGTRAPTLRRRPAQVGTVGPATKARNATTGVFGREGCERNHSH